MHVIVSTQGNRRWIFGILQDVRDAETACSSLLKTDDVRHRVQAIRPTQFPFFILEAHSGFSFLDPVEAEQVIVDMPIPAPNSEHILFAILTEYQPAPPRLLMRPRLNGGTLGGRAG